MENQKDKAFLLIGLESSVILNPNQVYQLLAKNRVTNNDGELEELSLCSEAPMGLPDVHQDGRLIPNAYQCKCEPLSIDQQRELSLSCRRQREQQQDRLNGQPPTYHNMMAIGDFKCELFDEIQVQMLSHSSRGHLTRKIRKTICRVRRKTGSMIDSRAQYQLEAFLREANTSLGILFSRTCKESQTMLTHQLAAGDERFVTDHDYLRVDVMIRAPTLEIAKPKVMNRSISGDSGVVDEDEVPAQVVSRGAVEFRHLALKRHLEFRASKRTRSIVDFSVVYLEELVTRSCLFELDNLGQSPRSSHELKLYACVECQRLKSSIRFAWLTKCLELALERDNSNWQDAHWLPWLVSSDQRAVANQDEDQDAVRYFDLLAALMGQLLRGHFLVPALDRWCCLLESLSKKDAIDKQMISLEVDLVDDPSEGQLSWQPIEERLKLILGYVVDELALVCSQMPRLESLLDSARSCQNERPAWLKCLTIGDDLLSLSKRRLGFMIDGSRPLEVESSSSSLNKQSRSLPVLDNNQANISRNWIDPDYQNALELVNLFRRADLDEKTVHHKLMTLSETEGATDEIEVDEKNDGRLRQLALNCKQVRLLHLLEHKLACQLASFKDYGFVQLDLRLARQTLVRSLQKERLLLVRYNADNLLKLWDRLRMQFDEIELGCDLESAIEDYLMDRWQAKQLQLQQQQSGSRVLADELQRQQVTLAAGDDYAIEEQDDFPLPLCEPIAPGDEVNQQSKQSADQSTEAPRTDEDEEDEFLQATMSSGNGAGQSQLTLASQAQLSKLNDRATARQTSGDLGLQDQRVAPLVECRLLLDRYSYMRQLLDNELEPLARDVELAFKGLIFLTEFVQVDDDQLETAHWDTIRDLTNRSREFGPILRDSLSRLRSAKLRLLTLNKLRSKVTSKLVLEFHLLMRVLGQRRLGPRNSSANEQPARRLGPTSVEQEDELEVADGALNIRQLDSIQDASDWSRKLESRWHFLWKQNNVLAKELHLLSLANLEGGVERTKLISWLQNDESITVEESRVVEEKDCGKEQRQTILERWQYLVSLGASLWRLADDYETQQVKWLNSDVKKASYEQISLSFKSFVRRLDELEASCSAAKQEHEASFMQGLVANMVEIRRRLAVFESQRLPLFKFLTNPHIGELHWTKLNQMAQQRHLEEPRRFALNVDAAQSCTTLAQFIELGLDRYVDQLMSLDKRATMEYQLSEFLSNEASLNLHVDRSSSKSLNVSNQLENWTEEDLQVAAWRFLDMRLAGIQDNRPPSSSTELIANQLVTIHSLVKSYLSLRYQLNLDTCCWRRTQLAQKRAELKLRSLNLLTSPSLVQPALFVGFLRLFAQKWLQKRTRLESKLAREKSNLANIQQHLTDIDHLIYKVEQLHQNDVRSCSEQSDSVLAKLERDTNKLELEREILATKEALAMEQQRTALRIRDDCIKQISERAIPSIRAAAKALDCLSESSLRLLRSIRPSPPESVRLVIEAVCLLRNCALTNRGQLAERRLDALTGRMVEDYWPVAKRTINSCHSCQFLADLRKVDKKSIPIDMMRLIRRKYLSSAKFQLKQIERVSPEAAHLARWLIAVDVFDRVINVVRPNYARYLEAEGRLAELLAELAERRRHIDLIGAELGRIEDYFEQKVALKGSLASLLAQCHDKLVQVRLTRQELSRRQDDTLRELAKFESKQQSLAGRCLMNAAQIVYIEPMRAEEQRSLVHILKSAATDYHNVQ